MNLVPLKLSYVRYVRGDLFGHLLGYFTLAPIYIAAYFATLILIRRDMQALLLCGGQGACVIFNLVLKQIFKEPRPPELDDLTDYGMPSNHSQFIGFFMITHVLSIFRIPSQQLPIWQKLIYSLCLVIFSVLVCYSRWYLKYHTKEQVIVGYSVGCIFGWFWHVFMHSKPLRSLSKIICDSRLGKYFCIRDYSDIPFPSVTEHENWLNSKPKTK